MKFSESAVGISTRSGSCRDVDKCVALHKRLWCKFHEWPDGIKQQAPRFNIQARFCQLLSPLSVNYLLIRCMRASRYWQPESSREVARWAGPAVRK